MAEESLPVWLDRTLLAYTQALVNGRQMPRRRNLHFIGPGLTVADNATTGATEVTISSAETTVVLPESHGAVGNGSTDDRAALQAALDEAALTGGTVLLSPGKNYRISAPLVIAAANSFVNVTLRTAQSPYTTLSTNARISVNYDDGPALVIQGSRRVRVQDVVFIGTNSFVANTSDMWDTSVFLVSGIRDNRYSPSCAIVLDPFLAGNPGGSASNRYPALTAYYTSAYDQASAGQTEILGCHFIQWNVGIMNSPSASTLGGDGLTMRDCIFDTCQWAYASGQAQTKGCVLSNCTATNIRGFVNTVSYGSRQGFAPIILGGSVGACRELFNINQQYGPFTCIGLFCETTLSIGVLGSNFASGAPAATFIGCEFALYYDSTYDSVDCHLIAYRPTIFIGGAIGFNSGTGTFRVHNGVRMVFDSVAFLASASNDHLPVDFQTPASVEFRDCQTLHSTPNQNGRGVLSTLALASGGTATLSRVSDGVAQFTLTGAGAELQVGDHIQRTTTGYNPALEDPGATPFTTSTSLGTVLEISSDTITLGQVPFTVEAALPLASIGYTRRRITFDPYGTTITANGGMDLPYPQALTSGGTAMVARDVFGENVYGTSGVPNVIAGNAIYLQEDGTVVANVKDGKMAIGQSTTAAAASALLELDSTTGALLITRMTSTQRDALTASNGMQIYNTTTDKFQGYAGGAWVDLH